MSPIAKVPCRRPSDIPPPPTPLRPSNGRWISDVGGLELNHEPCEPPPCFLVGSVRSGTTVLRLMLDHHPELAFFSEFEFAVDFMTGAEWPGLRSYWAYLEGQRNFFDSGFTIDPLLDYPGLVRSFLGQKRKRDRKSRVGATVHHDFDRLSRIWPDALFIYIIRDPRDVGRSRIDLGWSGNMHLGVSTWVKAEDTWEVVCRVVPAGRRVEVRYEELVREPEANLRRLCEFLGLRFSPAMLSYPDDTTYGPPDPNLIDQWRRKLSPEAIQLAEATVGRRLVDRGYEPSGLAPIAITPAMSRRLKWMDRLGRVAFRLRQFGVDVVLSQMLIHRVGPACRQYLEWESRVRDRVFEIERRYLK